MWRTIKTATHASVTIKSRRTHINSNCTSIATDTLRILLPDRRTIVVDVLQRTGQPYAFGGVLVHNAADHTVTEQIYF